MFFSGRKNRNLSVRQGTKNLLCKFIDLIRRKFYYARINTFFSRGSSNSFCKFQFSFEKKTFLHVLEYILIRENKIPLCGGQKILWSDESLWPQRSVPSPIRRFKT